MFLGNTLFGVNFSQSIIAASIPTSSVNFTETTSGVDPTAANAPFVQSQVNFPSLGDVISGASGSTGRRLFKSGCSQSGLPDFPRCPTP